MHNDFNGNESISSIEERILLGTEVLDERMKMFDKIESVFLEESKREINL